ncbi:TATA box-binding protein-associated factor RNA polymerase I subunit B isoform X3 [Aphis gossypii]|uniref:TATA box-binding protein-associated factor RNA polymerase I subunit B isoform X3 n=1 Tax=Aphis gossypii TaxID=80765 RepID=UPI002158C237|nr:TATA box-binding protein-associated factor RNA polymerase I subunit B isoform X3 [Aphis gossypii]
MQANECFVCGCNNFTVTDGAFVCNECGIQSQTIREEHVGIHENVQLNYEDPANIDHEITTGSQLEKAKKLLSWECYNFILLGLIDEIIELGAKPSLKIIVLQLWVQYLQFIEVAFTSKKFKKLPKLNTSINDVDCQILYGVKNLKNKILQAKIGVAKEKKKRCSNKRKSLSSSINSSITDINKQNRFSRKLKKLDHTTRDSNNDSVGLSDDISLLQRSNKSSKIKIKLTKNIKQSLTSVSSKTNDLTNEEPLKLFKTGRKQWNSLKRKEKKNVLSIKKLICILQLALMINDDDIYLSDILRSNIIDKKLFSWNNYVQYIEFRNCIVSKYNYVLHEKLYKNNIRNTQLFINDWNIMKPTLPILEGDKICKNFRVNTECLLRSLPDFGIKENYREIPASTKPLSSTIKWIVEYHSVELSDEAKRILEQNFTHTDILYLTNEKRIYDLAEECNIPIEVNFNSPLHYMKQKGRDPDTVGTLPYTAQTNVYLVNQELYENKQNETTNTSYEEKPNTIFLGTGSNYWYIHINKHFLRKANISKQNKVFKKKLPYSFLWFMDQCCRVLDCHTSDLYKQLMDLENEFFTLIQPNKTSSQTECEEMISNITL